MGIPVEGQRGVGGGYRIRPGYRLPPLMLTDEEAIAVTLGTIAAGRLGLRRPPGVGRRSAREDPPRPPGRASPSGRGARDDARLHQEPDAGAPVPGELALRLADAIRRRRRVRTAYRSFSGERTQRELSPHGLVVHSGRWYLAAFDHGRDDLRIFRVDRMSRAAVSRQPAVAPPDGFDAVAHVSRSLARVPWPWEVEVLLHLPVDQAAHRLPATLAELAREDGGTLLRMRVDSLDWTAGSSRGSAAASRSECPKSCGRASPRSGRGSPRAPAVRVGRLATLALMYHDVVAGDPFASGFQGAGPDHYKVSAPRFERHLDMIAATGLAPSLVGVPAELAPAPADLRRRRPLRPRPRPRPGSSAAAGGATSSLRPRGSAPRGSCQGRARGAQGSRTCRREPRDTHRPLTRLDAASSSASGPRARPRSKTFSAPR